MNRSSATPRVGLEPPCKSGVRAFPGPHRSSTARSQPRSFRRSRRGPGRNAHRRTSGRRTRPVRPIVGRLPHRSSPTPRWRGKRPPPSFAVRLRIQTLATVGLTPGRQNPVHDRHPPSVSVESGRSPLARRRPGASIEARAGVYGSRSCRPHAVAAVGGSPGSVERVGSPCLVSAVSESASSVAVALPFAVVRASVVEAAGAADCGERATRLGADGARSAHRTSSSSSTMSSAAGVGTSRPSPAGSARPEWTSHATRSPSPSPLSHPTGF